MIRSFRNRDAEALFLGSPRRFWSIARIRINDQYRICFVWKDGDARQVEVVDYH